MREIDDQLPALLPGGTLTINREHRYVIVATRMEGFHSGRRRYLVACTTCEKLLHEATTGAQWQIERHEDAVRPAATP